MSRHNTVIKISYFIVRTILGPFIRFFWIKKVTGLHNIPKTGPCIIAFNHQSYFDFLCFVAVSPRSIHYLSAEKFFSHPMWSILMHATGQIKVERKQRDKRVVHNAVKRHLERGLMIGIFPEGTRAGDPLVMRRAFSGVAKYAFNNNVPVIPVGIQGAFEVMSRFDKKPKFKKNISIIIGEPISFNEYHHVKMNSVGYQILTNKVMNEISLLSGKQYPHKKIVKR